MSSRQNRVWFAGAVIAVALAVEIVAVVALPFHLPAIVVGILACATISLGAFYVTYEGLDEVWRRPK